MKTLVIATASVLLHLFLGWAWTPLAGLAGGFWAERRGWGVGGVGVGLGWAVLVAWNFIANPHGAATFIAAMGSVMGNLPGVLIVVLTLLIGATIGALSGLAGQHLAASRRSRPGFMMYLQQSMRNDGRRRKSEDSLAREVSLTLPTEKSTSRP